MAVTGTLSAAKRSYPTSEVRGRSREDPIPKGQRPRGITPCPRAGAAAEECQTATAQERPRGATPRPREKKYSSIHQNIDTSFPNQETLTSHLYNPHTARKRHNKENSTNCQNTERTPQTQQFKQDEETEEYPADKGTG